MKAPFPWFGGKRHVADLVWSRLGDVDTYNEPFAGSLAVLLERPHEPRIETVNDLDCYISNFWRALQHAPDEVSKHADSPVNEADLHARHRWLIEVARPTAERVMKEPDFFDPKIAGWWVWGQCLWIGSGWCQSPQIKKFGQSELKNNGVGVHPCTITEDYGRAGYGVNQKRRPQLTGDQGVVIEAPRVAKNQKRPAHSGNGGSPGVHRRWQGGGAGGGSGVHAPSLSQQKPLLRDANGMGVLTGEVQESGLYAYMRQLAARLRRVRVCCGDWKRVLTPSVTTYIGTCGVFLDPPYAHDLRERCYSEDHDISAEVREWAIANGDNPDMRIALCGYEGEHKMPDTWSVISWKAHGGYSRSARGVANRSRERIWFSPHCLKPLQPELL